ncbi:MAG: hypothetical protein JF886_16565 [Candidatus Dormibacteraeota bacterium]|uniref:Uncharacterized protein n=1 Tax=Candidatus Aeolococcus gillhamiae TaxID=3127015 RepID=A0A2W6AFY9_9BACT|nr:hypothetical protein [Candidatus Dormibacteraeota bacterium]PZR84218.1 MAG: hypothetical protein DLM65_00385 [Candidatus Dormibacter sp. RRmetagenome_bin12]
MDAHPGRFVESRTARVRVTGDLRNNTDVTRYANDFFDIGQAGNTNTIPSCEPTPGPYSCSKTGWDYASGWGTPDITKLMKDLDGGNTTPVAFVAAAVPEAPATLLIALVGTTVAAAALRRRRRPRPI